jgi:hypothetical protein
MKGPIIYDPLYATHRESKAAGVFTGGFPKANLPLPRPGSPLPGSMASISSLGPVYIKKDAISRGNPISNIYEVLQGLSPPLFTHKLLFF